MSDSKNLLVRIKLEALISEREGMAAMNRQREVLGASMAYVDDDFFKNAEDIRALLKGVAQ